LALYRRALQLRESAVAADAKDHRAAVSVASMTEESPVCWLECTTCRGCSGIAKGHRILERFGEQSWAPWSNARDLADTHCEFADTLIEMKAFQER